MNDDDFLRGLAEQPLEDGRRAAYADWLEEQGDARARFVRMDLALSAQCVTPKCDPLRLKSALAAWHEAAEALRRPSWVDAVSTTFEIWVLKTPKNLRGLLAFALCERLGHDPWKALDRLQQLPALTVPRATLGGVFLWLNRIRYWDARQFRANVKVELRRCVD